MGLIREFKDFINKGNVIDLAVAVVIGAAFGDIVKKIVDGILMPIIGKILPAGSWETWAPGGLKVGSVIGAAINFLIIALFVFIVVQKIMKGKKKEEAVAAPPPPAEDVVLLREIRDLLRK
jgi:large conductance mechanosensitive channel